MMSWSIKSFARPTGPQAGMPALQSGPDACTIRDSTHIYRIRDYPRDPIERASEVVSVDFDAVDPRFACLNIRRLGIGHVSDLYTVPQYLEARSQGSYDS